MTKTMKADAAVSNNSAPVRRGSRYALIGGCLTAMAVLCLALPAMSQGQRGRAPSTLKRSYVHLTNNANAVLVEPQTPNRNSRIVVINTHPKNANVFEYFVGEEMGKRGYRTIEINDYGDETTFERNLAGIAAAVKYARSLPGAEKVVLIGHSGGGPELSYYEEMAENGPSACQIPDRLLPCDPRGLTDLPKADALLELEANAGAPHRTASIDPAVDQPNPRLRDPAFDMYAPQNGLDPKTNTAKYSADFVKRYWAGLHARSEKLIAEAKTRLQAIKDGKGPFTDDDEFLVPGMAEAASGARLYLADGSIRARTHGAHMLLKADGTSPVQIIQSTRSPAATPVRQRDTLSATAFNNTLKYYLSTQALTTTADFALTADNIKGVDWRSSANSLPGSVQNIHVPTLIMAGDCMIHMNFLEIAYDLSAAKDKEFVAVNGGDHYFDPCGPQYGDTAKRAFDYVDAWLNKRF